MNAEDLVITLKKNMAKLSKSERRRAIESVRDIIRAAMFDDAAGSGYAMERCPRCGSVAIVKKGKSRNGEQRYLCRDCGRTFSGSTDRILGTSKLPRETWMAYAECFVLMLPLRASPGTVSSATSAATAAGRSQAPPTGFSARANCPARPGWPMPSASSSCSRYASVPAAAASASRPPIPCATGSSSA